jgi:transketolase
MCRASSRTPARSATALPIAVGTAIAGTKDKRDFRVFTLLGDGELAEGSNWEGAMAAAHYDLDNLVAIVDHNTLQITGRTRDVCGNEPLDEKFRAFNWDVRVVDGHSIAQLTEAFSRRAGAARPLAIIANTTKGRGVSFMEDVARWHHGVPSDAEYDKAIAELDEAINRAEANLK